MSNSSRRNIFLKLMNLWNSRFMNQTYFEWYEFDVELAIILHCITVLINQRCSEYGWINQEHIVKFQYCCLSPTYILNFMSMSMMSSGKALHCWSLLPIWVSQKKSWFSNFFVETDVIVLALKIKLFKSSDLHNIFVNMCLSWIIVRKKII